MRKILSVFGVLLASMSVATFTQVRAEEVEDTEIVETTEIEEGEKEVITPTTESDETFSDKLNQFKEMWLTPICSSLAGVFGVLVGVLALRKKVIDLKEATESTNGKTKEEIASIKKEYQDAKQELNDKKEELKQEIINLGLALEDYKDLKQQITILKELVVLMVASNKELANNGYATKILELLDETEQKVVDVNANKEEV